MHQPLPYSHRTKCTSPFHILTLFRSLYQRSHDILIERNRPIHHELFLSNGRSHRPFTDELCDTGEKLPRLIEAPSGLYGIHFVTLIHDWWFHNSCEMKCTFGSSAASA